MKNIFRILGFILLICYGILYGFEGMSNAVKSGMGVAIALIILSYLFKFRSGWGIFLGLIFLLGIFSYAVVALSVSFETLDLTWVEDWNAEWNDEDEDEWNWEDEEDEWEWEDETEEDYIDEGEDSEEVTESDGYAYYVHEHSWRDNGRNKHSSTFKVRKNYFSESRSGRENHEVYEESDHDYWENVYQYLYDSDQDRMKKILDMYNEIGKEKNMNSAEFADMVVTSIQDIPYVLVHELTHDEADATWGGYIKEYHEEGGPCLDQIRFGIQSPVEFMSNFKGDCDTRSVFCYLVLTYFDYDVCVLASDIYGHAILGIAGNYRGKYVTYEGKKYYGWETTATGYEPGMMSPDCKNMKFWYVSLPSKI